MRAWSKAPFRPANIFVGLDSLGDFRVGDGEAELLGLLVERGAGQQCGQHLTVEADLARLVIGDRALGLTLHALQFVLIFGAILRDADFLVADRRQLLGAEIVEDVANAEEAEADHDQRRRRSREWRGRKYSST